MSNLSQLKRKQMLDYVNKLKEIHKDDESIIALNKIESTLTEKKYGLVWEEHSEKVDEMLKDNIPVFKEVKEKKIISKKEQRFNFLLEGDNLHSLKLLLKTHKGKIDLIYIDPPYNTKNKEFIYDDKIIDNNDGYKHSKWISFMYERLIIAKELLDISGTIFISIDDNEQAPLKMLCDEIFGEENFIGNICRQAIKGGSRAENIKTVHDYVLIYAKSKRDMNPFTGIEKEEIEFTHEDDKGPYAIGRELNKWGASSRREDSPTMWFPIKGPDGQDIYPIRNDGSEGRWRWGKSKLLKAVEDQEIIFRLRDDGTYMAYEKIRELKNNTTQFNTWFENDYINAKGSEALKKIFNTLMSLFDYAKPVELIYDICFMADNKNAIILDFFAGSGTTAQAVAELNRQDNGSRSYILCTDNYNDICESITYPRIKSINQGYDFSGKNKEKLFEVKLTLTNLKEMGKILLEIDETKERYENEFDSFETKSSNGFLELYGIKNIKDRIEGIPHNLKYYKTEFVPKLSQEEDILSNRLLDHIQEMVELENMCEIDGKNKVLLLNQEELVEWFEKGIVSNSKIYLPSYILLSREIEIECKKNNVEFIDVPDYYFLEELREANEL